ncbi:NAD(P)-dependent dehydrogenase (short-subunit alcohol dehydrogenase family) [Mycolicibacterium lutetiense]|uniref:NAD(P)-dependent dehydrogenase (Short-subunit alcohol dehydrogenase family) n=1 Tax=Mycolicibacterium lutetiense TaxID=1641992 RepID=A0ABS4ZS77_9MYCO|nr:NAD(P)-dependent dehydrogenase (short-subunit alcohol dehydrogenase family) [Mycolicibacterium lutetiense]
MTDLARYGPWAVIAGGSEGVGAEFARLLAEDGFNLVLLARKAGPLEATAQRPGAGRAGAHAAGGLGGQFVDLNVTRMMELSSTSAGRWPRAAGAASCWWGRWRVMRDRCATTSTCWSWCSG